MENCEFNQYLGKDVSLSRDSEVIKLAISRAGEICTMTQSLDNPQHTKLIFQKLPMHMRRRVMSHNAKRMPRRLREAHIKQMKKSGLAIPSKRPSRKYRRRPSNLLAEYTRRQQEKTWLETHIWHAKRFHMIEKWGYKIANYSNDRGYRANYRAVAKHCMMQDISFYNCIEISGPKDILTTTLKGHCKNELSFAAKAYISGNREGNVTFYTKSGIPLGVVNFLWKSTETEEKSIWIWIHPVFYKDVLNELISSFEFKETPTTFMNVENSSNLLENKNYNNIKGCKMELLKFSLNRFRLRGPLALSVLNETLRLPKSLQNHQESMSSDIDSMEVEVENSWESHWYRNLINRKAFESQKKFFETFQKINSVSQLPRNSVIGLTVLDPRFFLPPKREKPTASSAPAPSIDQLDLLTSHSPLWDASVRNNVKKHFKKTCEINKLRSQALVSGVAHDEGFSEKIISKVPIILIQCPGTEVANKAIGFNSGIDIIVPSGWALPFWLSFVYRCVRPGGLREYRSILFESLMLKSPEINHPDTPSYIKEAEETTNELTEKYFRYPPNRRVNFIKYAISSPFCCEWKILIKEWTGQETINVLRDQNILSLLMSAFKSFSNHHNSKKKRKLPNEQSTLSQLVKNIDKSLLIPVKIMIERHGRPKKFAIICIPTDEDLKKFEQERNFNGPIQQPKLDVFEADRKNLRKQHKRLLKSLMRKRAKARKNMKPFFPRISTNGIKELYLKKIRQLWLPQCKEVRKSCDREVMGYVVQGDFSFTESKGVGWGYVVMQTLLNLLEKKNNYVLVRNTQTKHYRLARIEILNICS
ncbi:ribonucleases P/MRP protein subunit POP1 [Chelonus insularis]|uniref:ribonucleases P/MRP protein subunit POP1 n=1 Tax=Chelonus insularis TaxID=460826 RepID=UPI00158D876D|nr:ribonucleases P/MRP protein subunit POP1 [Chelonus insularis]